MRADPGLNASTNVLPVIFWMSVAGGGYGSHALGLV